MLDLCGVPELAEVFSLLEGQCSPVDQYKVFEIVRQQVGGGGALEAMGWDAKSELKCFTRSVNHPDALGSSARHARSTSAPPAQPMDEAQTRAFIDRLVHHWVRWVAEERGVSLTATVPDEHST